jgi:hypothetical protein
MAEWIRAALDLMLICMVGAGLVQAARLIGHLSGLRQGRVDMERFVHEFNATVIRAETGIKGLRSAARESGDDLEKLVEKAYLVRDELQFIVESADQVAERLSQAATTATRPETKAPEVRLAAAAKTESKSAAPQNSAAMSNIKTEKQAPAPASRAEKELLQALQKLS